MKKQTETKMKETEKTKLVGAVSDEGKNISHKKIKSRGRIFEGRVTKRFPKRVVIEFERMVYSKKYERYFKAKTKIHARIPDNFEKEIEIGDLIKAQECRPLSKIIHFVIIKKIKGAEEK